MSNSAKKTLISKTPVAVKIIAWYFIIDGVLNIVDFITYISGYFKSMEDILTNIRFLYTVLPTFLSYDPFSFGLIRIPIYNQFAILIKGVATIFILLFAGYSLLKLKKIGWFLGIFIVVFGILVCILINPITYFRDFSSFITVDQILNSGWPFVIIALIINFFALFYLPTHKKIFK